jgi:hypothetical protein
MKTSEVLRAAWDLISQPGRHSKRAFARNCDMEAVHALHADAVSWDAVGAVKKTLGAEEGPALHAALLCLTHGAMTVSRGLCPTTINDGTDENELRIMFHHAIRAAQQVEKLLDSFVYMKGSATA